MFKRLKCVLKCVFIFHFFSIKKKKTRSTLAFWPFHLKQIMGSSLRFLHYFNGKSDPFGLWLFFCSVIDQNIHDMISWSNKIKLLNATLMVMTEPFLLRGVM